MSNFQKNDRSEKRYILAKHITFSLLAIILFIYGLIIIKPFLYPIAFGFLLAYLLLPVVTWLERHNIPRILANLISIIGALVIIGSLALIAYRQIAPFTIELPNLAERGLKNLTEMLSDLGEYFGFEKATTRDYLHKQSSQMLKTGTDFLRALFSATTSTIVAIGLMPVYIFLFLYYRTKFMYFLLMVFGRKNRRIVTGTLREISNVMVRYLAGVITVVLILCVINSAGLYIIGLKFAIPLGVTAAIFNFIPYFGTLLGGLVPFSYAFLVAGDLALTFRVVILFIIVQFIENNILTPNIVGGNVKINPFFIITGLVAASMIWGVPGMLLLAPFLAILRIISSHLHYMKPYAFLIGEAGTSQHTINVHNIKEFWNKKIRRK
ncbi:MAG: AI-2E family transporter [Bacteroidota bacterium]